MRSRYSAYALGLIDYLAETHSPETEEEFDREDAAGWSKNAEWLGLEVVSTRRGQEKDTSGEVEFIARYRHRGTDLTHHERSHFAKLDGRWYYDSGEVLRAPLERGPKIGRNEPCPCGSGKKHKKCCGARV